MVHHGSLRSPFNTRPSSKSSVERAVAHGGTFPRNMSPNKFSLATGEDFSSSQIPLRKSPRPSAQFQYAGEIPVENKNNETYSAPSTPSAATFGDGYAPLPAPVRAPPASPTPVATLAHDAPSFTPRYTKHPRSRKMHPCRAEEGVICRPPLLVAQSTPVTAKPTVLHPVESSPLAIRPYGETPTYSPPHSPRTTPTNESAMLRRHNNLKLGSTSYGESLPKRRASVAKHLFNGLNNVLGGGLKSLSGDEDDNMLSSARQSSLSRPPSPSRSLPRRSLDRTRSFKPSASLSNLTKLRTRR